MSTDRSAHGRGTNRTASLARMTREQDRRAGVARLRGRGSGRAGAGRTGRGPRLHPPRRLGRRWRRPHLRRQLFAAALVHGDRGDRRCHLARAYGAPERLSRPSGAARSGGAPVRRSAGRPARLRFALPWSVRGARGRRVYASRYRRCRSYRYSSSLWFLAVLVLGVATRAVLPRLVESLGLDRLEKRSASLRLGRCPPSIAASTSAMVPCPFIQLALVSSPRGAARSRAIAGPVVAAVSYWIPPMHLELWNRAAAIVVLILAVLSTPPLASRGRSGADRIPAGRSGTSAVRRINVRATG